ncbi:MAG: chemotaxis response regulator protein-glutamate methylesterase [Chloroflexi bacterium]|nr:chemotaxis response regulator protein-glutamate methylesterase [Chloroflexota bacterium]
MKERVRVLVVDDSVFARNAISRSLETDPDVEVVGTAADGIDAIEQVKALRPDVVTLDVSMPRMDGIEALERIMSECPTPIVMLSALTGENTHATLEALEKGAVDFFLKSSTLTPAGLNGQESELVVKIKTAAKVPIANLVAASKTKLAQSGNRRTRVSSTARRKILVIGSSTGGPRALAALMPQLPADLPAAILMVQHMPAQFTRTLAERLNRASDFNIKGAKRGDSVAYGTALMAPGGYHMVVKKTGAVDLNQDSLVCGVRPSADVLMKSVAETYGNVCLGVILTGMGSDGTEGSRQIRLVGGKIAAEHESSCAVYGMPKSVIESGNADTVAPLSRLADEIIRMCNE